MNFETIIALTPDANITVQLYSIQFNSIPFNSIQFNSIQFSSVQFSSILFCSVLFYSILSYPILIVLYLYRITHTTMIYSDIICCTKQCLCYSSFASRTCFILFPEASNSESHLVSSSNLSYDRRATPSEVSAVPFTAIIIDYWDEYNQCK